MDLGGFSDSMDSVILLTSVDLMDFNGFNDLVDFSRLSDSVEFSGFSDFSGFPWIQCTRVNRS